MKPPRICPDCGASLDPQEICDCKGTNSKNSVSMSDFDKWVRLFAKNNGISISKAYEHPTVKIHRLVCLGY